jgi:LacI family transcriptional regulator
MKRSTSFRRPTIKDVASLSGVSKATVSNVVRGTGSVSDATRLRVQEAIAALGYRPNASARNLVRQRTDTLGLIAGNLGNAFEAELVERFEQAAAERDFTTLVCTTGRHHRDEAARLGTLLEQRVAGIAMLQFTGDRRLVAQLVAEQVPVVMVSFWDDYVDCVAVDDDEGLELAVGHLADLGIQRIAYLTDELIEGITRRIRLEAFERALLRHGLAFRDDWVIHAEVGPDGIESGDMASLLDSADRPQAIVATNDDVAVALMEHLEAHGHRVPDEISVVGFDGSRVAALSRVGLTTVAQPVQELAQTSVDLLLERVLGDPSSERRHVRMEPRLIVRTSTSPPRA